MAFIKINQEKATDKEALVKLCPFGAIEVKGGKLEINAGCRMCRMCIKRGGGVFELVEDAAAATVDKSQWRGVAVVAEIDADGQLHPVALELLGKARELAAKISHPVLALAIGANTGAAVEKGVFEPRLPSYRKKLATADREITWLKLGDLEDTDSKHYGLNGSPTQVKRIFPPESHVEHVMIEGSSEEQAAKLAALLAEKKFLQ